MAREWVINDYSGYKGLVLQECDTQNPGPGEIRLRIEAFALNWGDMDLMLDRYSFSFNNFPARIGMEAAGIVDQIGEGVTGIEIGARYCTLPYFYFNKGASADSVTIDARYVTPAPKNLSAVESSSVWMQFMTAYYPIVELSKAAPGKNILVTAATSTAGNAALNIGKIFGANMIATTRFEQNRDYLLESGASHVIVTGENEIAATLRKMTDNHGIDAAFDPVGEGMIAKYSPALARDATIFFYGTLDGVFPQLPIVDMFQANATFHPYSLFNYVEDSNMQAKGTAFVYKALEEGKLRPNIDRVYPMEEYREAWEYLRKPRTKHGKVVIETGL
ncbi:MAG: 2-haloacrylate reductase [Alphaproteobacteria bacterium MarineAlpha5_Bin9]|nr:MAG: 2-haloacrylate reductase [Alphaproteobacteria bacterium MarineAlpha5_Bin9]|tara:strand:- start:198 stop:1196 length:999 start_codon:yes stop_codon:yes gene_type:complete